jgi:hypothetical protein
MASAKDFARLEQINGIARYILARSDGQMLSQNRNGSTKDALLFASLIAHCGVQCDAMTTDMSGNRYIHLSIERESGDDLLVFSLGQFYLGVFKDADSDRQKVIDNVIYFLKNLS